MVTKIKTEAVTARINAIEKNLNKSVWISHGGLRLKYLLCFLSIDFDNGQEPKGDDANPFFRGIIAHARYRFDPSQLFNKRSKLPGEILNWRRKAKAVQQELRTDLMRIVTPNPQQDHQSFVSEFFGKLQNVNRRLGTTVASVESPRPPVKTIKNRRRRFWEIASAFYDKDGGALLLGGKVYDLSWTPSDLLRDQIYFQLAGAVEERCLEDLKLCQQCQGLYVRSKAKQKFCRNRCKDVSNNRKRLKTKDENGKTYFQNNRATHRKGALKKARALLKQGKSILRIVDETGLSERVLKKARVFH